MSINPQQFEQLSAMGISLWAQKPMVTNSVDDVAHKQRVCSINLQQLILHPLFNDIILSLGLSIGEIRQDNNHLDLGLFSWYFTADDNHDMQWSTQQLFTPSLENIAQSPDLKRRLWQILSNHHV